MQQYYCFWCIIRPSYREGRTWHTLPPMNRLASLCKWGWSFTCPRVDRGAVPIGIPILALYVTLEVVDHEYCFQVSGCFNWDLKHTPTMLAKPKHCCLFIIASPRWARESQPRCTPRWVLAYASSARALGTCMQISRAADASAMSLCNS